MNWSLVHRLLECSVKCFPISSSHTSFDGYSTNSSKSLPSTGGSCLTLGVLFKHNPDCGLWLQQHTFTNFIRKVHKACYLYSLTSQSFESPLYAASPALVNLTTKNVKRWHSRASVRAAENFRIKIWNHFWYFPVHRLRFPRVVQWHIDTKVHHEI